MAYAYSIDPSAPPVSQEDWDSCFLAKTSAHLCRHYSLSFKRLIPNLGGGRLGVQGNMFVDKMFKLRYKNEQTITFSVSLTYNSPIVSLKIKVIHSYFTLDDCFSSPIKTDPAHNYILTIFLVKSHSVRVD